MVPGQGLVGDHLLLHPVISVHVPLHGVPDGSLSRLLHPGNDAASSGRRLSRVIQHVKVLISHITAQVLPEVTQVRQILLSVVVVVHQVEVGLQVGRGMVGVQRDVS